ncbi:hypothetical protein DPMN_111133 [Dreissena polymorpha]|uniref:Uncharacterized protein n=1 Tax=Dreissena polymorpha TaxID=45954 RepID=A0A9D4KEA1_DREPO|nr:hypothetical protein DPMN_111133 [Dreissena polymorpha]
MVLGVKVQHVWCVGLGYNRHGTWGGGTTGKLCGIRVQQAEYRRWSGGKTGMVQGSGYNSHSSWDGGTTGGVSGVGVQQA